MRWTLFLILQALFTILDISRAAPASRSRLVAREKALVNGVITDFPWLDGLPPNERQAVNIPDVIENGVILHPVGGGTVDTTKSQPVETAEEQPKDTTTEEPGIKPVAANIPVTNQPVTLPSGNGGCRPNLKSVTFNSGYNAGMFDTIGAADSWTSFGTHIAGQGTDRAMGEAFIPMMPFQSNVQDAVEMVTGKQGAIPKFLLTFNEPDHSYELGPTPKMEPEDAAVAIKPLLDAVTDATKLIAPVPADIFSDWLPRFYKACGCQGRFYAYNIHIYAPTAGEVKNILIKFRSLYGDKPTWVTELAPGNANCGLSDDAIKEYMNDVYAFGGENEWLERIFWNTGNRINANDKNVCQSYLLDETGGASPWLDTYKNINCKGVAAATTPQTSKARRRGLGSLRR